MERRNSEGLEVEPREMPAIRWQKKESQELSHVPLKQQNSQGSRGCQGKRWLRVLRYREIKASSWKKGKIGQTKLRVEGRGHKTRG